MTSAIYAVNQMEQVVSDGGMISFGDVIRKTGRHLRANSGAIISGKGWYNADAHFVFSATAGDAIIQILEDGIPVAEEMRTTSAGLTYSITLPFMYRTDKCCGSTLTARIMGVTGTFDRASIVVERVGAE